MPKLKGRSARRLVLDVGSSAIRLCELAQTKSGYQLSKYYQREMVIDPALDEAARREIRLNALRELLKEAKARSKKVIFGVPGQSVFTRTRALPPVPEHKVTQIVRYEIQQQIPFSLDQIALDYQVLGRTDAGGYEVLMAAIKVDVVDKHLELLHAVKRAVEKVDVAPLAAYNWLKHTGEFGDQGECVALLDIGAATTDIVIERDNQFRFTRSLNIGGNDITSALARNFNVPYAEAERLKRERGFAPTGDAQRDGKGGEVIGQVLNRLVSEIARSFGYFRSQPGGGPVSRVILTGGTASLRNIVPYLQRQLGLDVRIAQPLAGLAVSASAQEANERPEQAAVALGLALRCIQTVPIEIDLIPPRIVENTRRKEQAFYWALSIVTLALIMASTVPLRAKRTDVINRQIAALKGRLATFDSALPINPQAQTDIEKQADAREKDQKDLQVKIKTLDEARTKRHFWLNYLRVINDSRPPGKGVWFSCVQTTVIGGEKNTGSDASGGGAASTPAVAAAGSNPFGSGARTGAAASGGGAAASGSGAARTGAAASGGGGAFSGLGGGGFNMAATGGGAASDATSTGFPGIEPVIDTGSAKGGPSKGGGRGGLSAAAGPPLLGAKVDENAKSKPPIEPNGFIITGYAETPEVISDFVKRLKESKKFIEEGVYLDESATNNVSMAVLYNAPVDAAAGGGRTFSGGGGGGGSDRRRGGDDSDDDGGGFGGGAGSSYGASPNALAEEQGPLVTAFRIDVQFAGKPVQLAEAQSLSQGGRRQATASDDDEDRDPRGGDN